MWPVRRMWGRFGARSTGNAARNALCLQVVMVPDPRLLQHMPPDRRPPPPPAHMADKRPGLYVDMEVL